jgi:hypothetical protein
VRHLQKVLLLSAVAVAGVVLAAPGVAQAEGPYWHVNSQKLEASEEFALEGGLTFKHPFSEKFTFEINCPDVGSDGALENGEEAAEGAFSSFFLVAPGCITNIPGCHPGFQGTDTPTSIVTREGEVDITDFGVYMSLHGCESIGIPNGWVISIGGTLVGEWDNETGCLAYEDAGELQFVVAEKPVFVDGELCLTAPGGAVTLE